MSLAAEHGQRGASSLECCLDLAREAERLGIDISNHNVISNHSAGQTKTPST